MKSQRKDQRLYNKGTLAMMDGRLDEAIDLLGRTARNGRDPSLRGQAWGNLGVAYRRSGRLSEARDAFEQALEIDPHDTGARSNLGNTLREMGDHESAESSYRQVQEERVNVLERHIQTNPDDTTAHHDLAVALLGLGESRRAEVAARRAVEIDPSFAQAWSTLATIQSRQGQSSPPLRSMLQATRLEPGNMEHQQRLGFLLIEQGQAGAAIRLFRAIAEHEPDNLDAVAGLATALERTGKLDDAFSILQPVIDSGAIHARVGSTWASVCARRGEPERAVPALVHMLEATLDTRARIMLLAALGAAHDHLGDYDSAFDAYTQANRLRQGRFEPAALIAQTDAIIHAFSAENLAELPRSTDRSEQPLFIIGMPRSGTSLVEQILASHPAVFGGGELEDLRVSLSQVTQGLGKDRTLRSLTAPDLTQIGQWYLDRRRQQSPESTRVTDKMPQNFQLLGWASLILPGVRIIHCKRDPYDTALSCYFQSFRDGLAWSNRLDWLGCFVQQYRRIMDHWNEVCPLPIHEVDYQALVADPEPNIRALVEFCGLDWDDAVLSHHTSGRHINTSSYAQVTRPIYSSSVGRARRYADHLEPLRKILDDQ